MKKHVVIITNGVFPVPAVNGGAVETLVEQLIKENEFQEKVKIDLYSVFNSEAEKKSKIYHNTKFHFIYVPKIIMKIDNFIYFIAYRFFRLSNHLSFSHIFQSIHYIFMVAKLLNKKNYDAIIFENQLALLWSLKYKDNFKKNKEKIYFHLHNRPAKYAHTQKIVQSIKIIGVSNFINNLFRKEIGIELNDSQFYVFRNNIDCNIFSPNKINSKAIVSIKNSLGIKNENVILFVGRLIEGKGIRNLLEAVKDITNIKIVIVGSYNFGKSSNREDFFQKQLYELIEENNDKIIFVGYVINEKLPKYYAAADIVVLPSICDEAAGLTMLEAVAMNKPLITTNAGGIPEYIKKETAIILDKDDNLSLKLNESIKCIISNDNLRNRLVSNTLIYRNDLGIEKYYSDFIEIII